MKQIARNALLLMGLVLGSTAQAGKVTYVYTDPQGTPLAEADASGNITATFDYTPYGVPVQGLSGSPNGPGYTGHVNDPDTGFVYMQARYYDPVVGRFLSVDPIEPAVGEYFSFNRFSFTNLSPLVNVDPDGMQTMHIGAGDTEEEKKLAREERDRQRMAGGTHESFPEFGTLWASYPASPDGVHAAHPSKDGYPNQCAVRLSYALIKAGVDMSSYPSVNKTSEGYARSAKNLADWIWKRYGQPQRMSQSQFQERHWYTGHGIIFLSPPKGAAAHIDLFNKGFTGSGYYKADEVWYWEVK